MYLEKLVKEYTMLQVLYFIFMFLNFILTNFELSKKALSSMNLGQVKLLSKCLDVTS